MNGAYLHVGRLRQLLIAPADPTLLDPAVVFQLVPVEAIQPDRAVGNP
jgi:hypothetical protein